MMNKKKNEREGTEPNSERKKNRFCVLEGIKFGKYPRPLSLSIGVQMAAVTWLSMLSRLAAFISLAMKC